MKFGKGKLANSILGKALQNFLPKESDWRLDYDGIMSFLQDEMEKSKRSGKNGIHLPNCYRVFLNSQDYQRMASRRMLDDLETGIRRKIILMNAFVPYRLQVLFVEDDSVEAGDCELELSFLADEKIAKEVMEDTHTLVLQREDLALPGNLPAKRFYAKLEVIDKNTVADDLLLGEKQVYVGRKASNDLILTDPNISRLHAYIKYDQYRHFIQDTESLNGVFVNGKRITGVFLQQGDKVQLGETLLQYLVL